MNHTHKIRSTVLLALFLTATACSDNIGFTYQPSDSAAALKDVTITQNLSAPGVKVFPLEPFVCPAGGTRNLIQTLRTDSTIPGAHFNVTLTDDLPALGIPFSGRTPIAANILVDCSFLKDGESERGSVIVTALAPGQGSARIDVSIRKLSPAPNLTVAPSRASELPSG